jgi:hypothetical protein
MTTDSSPFFSEPQRLTAGLRCGPQLAAPHLHAGQVGD